MTFFTLFFSYSTQPLSERAEGTRHTRFTMASATCDARELNESRIMNNNISISSPTVPRWICLPTQTFNCSQFDWAKSTSFPTINHSFCHIADSDLQPKLMASHRLISILWQRNTQKCNPFVWLLPLPPSYSYLSLLRVHRFNRLRIVIEINIHASQSASIYQSPTNQKNK